MTHLKGFSVGILLSAAQTGRIFPSSPPRIKYLVISAFFLICPKDGKSVAGYKKRPRGPNLAREPPYGHPCSRSMRAGGASCWIRTGDLRSRHVIWVWYNMTSTRVLKLDFRNSKTWSSDRGQTNLSCKYTLLTCLKTTYKSRNSTILMGNSPISKTSPTPSARTHGPLCYQQRRPGGPKR